jgi:hypothetical protein
MDGNGGELSSFLTKLSEDRGCKTHTLRIPKARCGKPG